MKKLVRLIILWSFLGIMPGYGQNIPTFSIPSYNIPVNGYATFINANDPADSCGHTMEKKDVNIHLTGASDVNQQCHATVWVYTLDQSTILGPFIVYCGGTLIVEIDNRAWGVLMQSSESILANVWIE